MKALLSLLAVIAAVAPAPTLAADAEAGLRAVSTLGQINGQALACAETRIASRARELMLAHAPKTQRFGSAYEDATQAAFAAQTRDGKPCPDALDLTARLNSLSLELDAALPVQAK